MKTLTHVRRNFGFGLLKSYLTFSYFTCSDRSKKMSTLHPNIELLHWQINSPTCNLVQFQIFNQLIKLLRDFTNWRLLPLKIPLCQQPNQLHCSLISVKINTIGGQNQYYWCTPFIVLNYMLYNVVFLYMSSFLFKLVSSLLSVVLPKGEHLICAWRCTVNSLKFL